MGEATVDDRVRGDGDSRPLKSFVTSRPVAILMLFLAAVVFGFFSYGRLPVNLMPELTYPTLTVRTEYGGAAPEEVENDISRPIEEALGVVGGLEQISSVSRAGVSDVVLEFAWDTDISDATQDVLERLDLVFLPSEAEKPLILHFDPSLDPVLELSLAGSSEEFQGEEGLRRLRRLAELQVKRSLEPIRGVAAVRIKGGLEEEIHVLVDEEKLRRSELSISQVINRLAQENINVAGGTIQEGRTEYLVRTVNEFQSVSEIGETIVTRVDDRDVRISDIGRVEYAHKERQIVTRTDGNESVQIEIFKEADANIVDLAKRIKGTVGEIRYADPDSTVGGGDGQGATAGPRNSGGERGRGGLAQQLYEAEGAELRLVADRSLFIESSIREVRNTAVLGGLLAVLVLFLFLRNATSTAIVALSIPISLLVTFAPLQILGVSLNIMSLGGLALGIGMLVDSSIVVLESIHRCREEGDDLVPAAIRGTEEVRGAVAASILTSIAVFFPMVFVEGVAGQAFGDLGLAVVVSLLASLAVAIFFIPMLASRRGISLNATGSGDVGVEARTKSSSSTSLRRFRLNSWSVFARDFSRMRWAVRLTILPLVYLLLRLIISSILEVFARIVLFVFSAGVYVFSRLVWPALSSIFKVLGWAPVWATNKMLDGMQSGYPDVLRLFLKNPSLAVFLLIIIFAVTAGLGRSLDSELLPEVRQGEFTFEVALPVGTPLEETERILTPVQDILLAEREHIRALILTLGFDPSQSQRSDEGEHTARFKVLLDGGGRNADREDDVAERIRKRLDVIPDLDARVTRPVLFSSKTPIEVEVHCDDLDRIRTYSDRAMEVLAELPELTDVQATLRPGAPEVQVVYDRERLSRFGLNISQVAGLVRDKVKGAEATRFNRVNRRVPILVQLEEEDRRMVEDVSDIIVNPGAERPIPLAAVAEVSLGEGPSEIRRIDGSRVAVVRANLADGSLSAATDAIRNALESEMDWPSDVSYLIGGQNKEWERSQSSLLLALGLSVFLVYVIMAAQFESLLHPFVIMFTIPLAFVGTFLVLKALSIPLSVVVFLGMIMLAGIVVNNAIVLVDYINTLRRRGMNLEEAIITAGQVRLRPILMTTTTTVLGLLPMALGLGDGAEIRTPMAIAVISGLLSSTFLTLFMVPSIYGFFETVAAKARQSLGRGEDEMVAHGRPAQEV